MTVCSSGPVSTSLNDAPTALGVHATVTTVVDPAFKLALAVHEVCVPTATLLTGIAAEPPTVTTRLRVSPTEASNGAIAAGAVAVSVTVEVSYTVG